MVLEIKFDKQDSSTVPYTQSFWYSILWHFTVQKLRFIALKTQILNYYQWKFFKWPSTTIFFKAFSLGSWQLLSVLKNQNIRVFVLK